MIWIDRALMGFEFALTGLNNESIVLIAHNLDFFSFIGGKVYKCVTSSLKVSFAIFLFSFIVGVKRLFSYVNCSFITFICFGLSKLLKLFFLASFRRSFRIIYLNAGESSNSYVILFPVWAVYFSILSGSRVMKAKM